MNYPRIVFVLYAFPRQEGGERTSKTNIRNCTVIDLNCMKKIHIGDTLLTSFCSFLLYELFIKK